MPLRALPPQTSLASAESAVSGCWAEDLRFLDNTARIHPFGCFGGVVRTGRRGVKPEHGGGYSPGSS